MKNPFKLTALGFAVCRAIDESEYGDDLRDEIWTFSLVQYFAGDKNQLAGAVAGLVKQGYAMTRGVRVGKGFEAANDEATVMLTDAGAKAYLAECVARKAKPRKKIYEEV